jgi:hypothetical protein
MKILILGLSVLASVPFMNFAQACQLSIPESYIPTFLAPPVSGNYMKCEDKPEEKCFCVDNVDPYISELVDNIVLDYIAKSNEIICTDELDCDAKFIELSCSLDEEKIKNYDLLSVYCAKSIYKIDGKKLAENAEKKAAYKAAKEAKKIAKDVKIAKKLADKVELFALKKADIDAMTVSQRNAVMIKLINIVQEIDE